MKQWIEWAINIMFSENRSQRTWVFDKLEWGLTKKNRTTVFIPDCLIYSTIWNIWHLNSSLGPYLHVWLGTVTWASQIQKWHLKQCLTEIRFTMDNEYHYSLVMEHPGFSSLVFPHFFPCALEFLQDLFRVFPANHGFWVGLATLFWGALQWTAVGRSMGTDRSQFRHR